MKFLFYFIAAYLLLLTVFDIVVVKWVKTRIVPCQVGYIDSAPAILTMPTEGSKK